MIFLKKFCVVVVSLAILGMSIGCYGVGKQAQVNEQAIIGGGVGSAIGAGAGSLSSLGSGPGALVGLSVGMATGALTASYYYDDPEGRPMDDEELQQLQQAIQERDRRVEELEIEAQEREAKKRALMESQQDIQSELERLKKGMGDNVRLSADESGAFKVTMLADVMFDSGSADLAPDGIAALDQAASQIRDQFPDAFIEVRGHTDNEPITVSGWSSNWELSTARAVSVLHYLVNDRNFDEDRIRAVGFADTEPVADNDTKDGRRKNRRAEIVIMPKNSPAAKELGVN